MDQDLLIIKDEDILEDGEILESLGAEVVDKDEFEKNILEKLQVNDDEELIDQTNTRALVDDGDKVDDVIFPNDKPRQIKILPATSNNALEKKNNRKMLNKILTNEETEMSKNIREGEMTPFGSIVLEKQAKKDSYLCFSKYLIDQQELQKKFVKDQPADNKKKVKNSSKTKVSGKVKGKKRNDSLKMDILFPKKKRKKEKIGTKSSRDPTLRKKKVGKLASETTSIYLNESENSDYVPEETDDDDEYTDERPKLKRIAKRKLVVDQSDSENSSDYDSPTERPVKKFKKETDDGNPKDYERRVLQWKENEKRFTGNYKNFDGGFKIPIHIWESLYNYQKVGVKWLLELHQQRSGGILGDEMGLGKTIQIISFLIGLSCSNLLYRFSEFRGLGPVLIVAPVTILHQWLKEFHTWWPPFRVVILHDSGSYSGTKQSLINSIIKSGKGILLTSYGGIVNNKDEILKHNWHYIILDEGHKIRNPDAQITLTVKQIKTPHRLILSGSPLQNNLKELWSLFDFIYPGKLGILPTFIEQFSVPITLGGYANATDIQVQTAFKCCTILRDIINPYLLRRMKDDVKSHINLPPKSEQVLFCKLTPEQRATYINYINSKEIGSIVQGSGSSIFVGLINLRKICDHPHLFDGGPKILKSSSSKKKEKLLIPEKRIPQVKSFKEKYVEEKDEEEEEESDLELDPNEKFGHWSRSGKMIVVETLLKLWHQQKHKVLLFTQGRQMLCILENFLIQNKYTFLKMDGTTSIGSRQGIIKQFNEDPNIFVFVLTTKVGGLGINLTGGSRVLIFSPDWNPTTDTQARERAWRIGQDKQVTIYRLITAGTIEEKIYHRQIFKQYLTNRVLKDPRQKRFFKSNDLLELFSFNEGTNGTETEAIFAGTDSNVNVPKALERIEKVVVDKKEKAREKSSGKFRNVPYLVKQRKSKEDTQNDEEELAKEKMKDSQKQDDYVLRKLFRKSGVQTALKHDKIIETNEADYLIVEKEAEKVAKDAIKILKQSRSQCWSAESGRVNWTGNAGQIRSSRKFGPKTPKKSIIPSSSTATATTSSLAHSSDKESKKYFDGSKDKSLENSLEPMTSNDILSMIRNRNKDSSFLNNSNIRSNDNNNEEEDNNSSADEEGISVKSEYMELLNQMKQFMTCKENATTQDLIFEFGPKLPQVQTPLFKKLLEQICTFRKVDGKGVWKLKLEFR